MGNGELVSTYDGPLLGKVEKTLLERKNTKEFDLRIASQLILIHNPVDSIISFLSSDGVEIPPIDNNYFASSIKTLDELIFDPKTSIDTLENTLRKLKKLEDASKGNHNFMGERKEIIEERRRALTHLLLQLNEHANN